MSWLVIVQGETAGIAWRLRGTEIAVRDIGAAEPNRGYFE
jgi:hypothetical protein